jgi:uncharacterized protein (DUF2147 family)
MSQFKNNMLRLAMSGLIFMSVLIVGYTRQIFAATPSPEGYWRTVPDDDSYPALIRIWKENDKIYGKVVKLFPTANNEPNPICDQCNGNLKNKPVIGMNILYDLKLDGNEWVGGKILDPRNGNLYNSYIEVIEGGKKLKVRGYIGFSLLGRTQYWNSVDISKQ